MFPQTQLREARGWCLGQQCRLRLLQGKARADGPSYLPPEYGKGLLSITKITARTTHRKSLSHTENRL